ncbi:hypothetical protein [Pyrobaculum aerophilum]|uniref:hypothetical protein n=1 Tax=Pyrobaculum aerophilum TaxID=13773 RepID=UPI002FDACB32
MSSEDKLGGNIVMNLFSILPSNNKIKINFVQRKSSSEINRLIYELEKHGCISGPQYGEYLGLSPGVYFICSDKMPENIDYTTIEIESTSYVIKYILLKSIQKKFENLGISKKVYLPRKWSEYSQITVCDKDVIVKSKRGLFEVRQCLVMRVEHLVIDDENKLFLLADLKIRRFSHLSLDKIINILKQETKYYDNEIEDLLKSHFYRCDTNMGTCACRLIGLQNDSVVVSTPWGR